MIHLFFFANCYQQLQIKSDRHDCSIDLLPRIKIDSWHLHDMLDISK
jgi:hypothetical protein